jgi:hypothetical protein
MKKIFHNILMLFSLTALIVSCNKDEFTVLNPDANTTASLSASEIVLLKENADQDALTVSWTNPNFGYKAGAEYDVTFTYGDKSKVVSAGIDLSKVFETVELNKLLLGIGVPANTPTEVNITVHIVLSAYKEIVSNDTSLTATIYEDDLDLSTTWGIVGSATPNGWDGPDVPFYTTSDPAIIVAYPTLIDGEIKVRENNEWGNDYGDKAPLDGIFDKESDNNIPVKAGRYKLSYNINTLAYTLEPYTWGLVGSATENGWDGPDMPLEYNPLKDSWKAIVTLTDGEMKIRKNNDWDQVNYGDKELDGILDREGDNNIPVEAGTYLITVDFKTLEYSLEKN